MRLISQRVVQSGTRPARAAGFNAFCYLHGDRTWLDDPPADLGPGQLANQVIEVDPPSGNRVRSYLDIVTPDATPNQRIVASVQAGTEFLAEAGNAPPWRLGHGEVWFAFGAEAALARHWQIELRLLLGYALMVRGA